MPEMNHYSITMNKYLIWKLQIEFLNKKRDHIFP